MRGARGDVPCLLLAEVHAHPLQLALPASNRLLQLLNLLLRALNVGVVSTNLLLELRALLLGRQLELLILSRKSATPLARSFRSTLRLKLWYTRGGVRGRSSVVGEAPFENSAVELRRRVMTAGRCVDTN